MDKFNGRTLYMMTKLDDFSITFMIISFISGLLFNYELYGSLVSFLIYTLVTCIRIFLVDFYSSIVDLNKGK